MKRTVIFLLLFPFVLSGYSQDYEVAVTTVQVWIKAVDGKGIPVEGLTEADFEVFEGRQKMSPTCFEEIKQEPISRAITKQPEATATPQISAQPEQNSNPTKVVLFLDLLNTSQAEYLVLKERSREFFQSIKERDIPMMLVVLTPTGRLGILERFTTNIDRIQARFGHLQANSQRDTRVSNARREISRILRASPHLSPAVKAAENVAYQAQRREEEEAEHMLSALEAFQMYWSGNHSEHAVVFYASGGVNTEPGRQYYDMIASFRADMAQSGGLENPNNWQETRMLMKKVARQLNRSNLTFYTLNTRGPLNVVDNIYEPEITLASNTNYLADYQEVQDVLAKETGGLSFRNTVNFGDALKTMVVDISHYYLICYSSPQSEQSEYRRIQVRTKREGVKLRHRVGYMN